MTGFKCVVKKTIGVMVVLWLIGTLVLWLGGMNDHLIGFQIGSVIGLVYCLSLAMRLARVCDMEEKAAVRTMQLNTMMRVSLTFLTLLLASKISFGAFQGCVIAIAVLFVGRLAMLIYAGRAPQA